MCVFDSIMSRMAVGYGPDGSVAPLFDLGWVAPAGQMFSTTADLNTVSKTIGNDPGVKSIHAAYFFISWPTSSLVLLERMVVILSTQRSSLLTCVERWSSRVGFFKCLFIEYYIYQTYMAYYYI